MIIIINWKNICLIISFKKIMDINQKFINDFITVCKIFYNKEERFNFNFFTIQSNIIYFILNTDAHIVSYIYQFDKLNDKIMFYDSHLFNKVNFDYIFNRFIIPNLNNNMYFKLETELLKLT